jgi:hypothetical protein
VSHHHVARMPPDIELDTLNRNSANGDTQFADESVREHGSDNVENGEFKLLHFNLGSRYIQIIVIGGTREYLLHI